MKAIRVGIYKHENEDSSNGGISSKYNHVLVLHPAGWIDIDKENPPENLCRIVERVIFGKLYTHVEPVQRPKHLGWMYGGCNVDCSDSRWHEMAGSYPLHLHDRQETQEQYDLLFD